MADDAANLEDKISEWFKIFTGDYPSKEGIVNSYGDSLREDLRTVVNSLLKKGQNLADIGYKHVEEYLLSQVLKKRVLSDGILKGILSGDALIDSLEPPVIPTEGVIIGGVPYHPSGTEMKVHTTEDRVRMADACIAALGRDNYQIEVELIRRYGREIISSIREDLDLPIPHKIVIVDLGVGGLADKLLALNRRFLRATRKRANKGEIYNALIDISQILLSSTDSKIKSVKTGLAADAIRQGRLTTNIINAEFKDLSSSRTIQHLASLDDTLRISTMFGSTFLQNDPELSCHFLRLTGCQYHIVGAYIYMTGQPWATRDSIVNEYETEKMKNLAAGVLRYRGISWEDIETKCKFDVKFQEAAYKGKDGLEFDPRMKAVFAYYIAEQAVQEGLGRIYQPDEAIGGIISFKPTITQLKTLFDKQGFEILMQRREGPVVLYLLKDTRCQRAG